MSKIINAIICLRRDKDYNFDAIRDTFIPANGEVVLVDTATSGLRVKIGDGISTFSQLPYMNNETVIYDIADTISENNTGLVTSGLVYNFLNSYATKASPALTGIPTAPTAVNGTDTTQIATTAFVQNTLEDNFSNLKVTTLDAVLYSHGNADFTATVSVVDTFPNDPIEFEYYDEDEEYRNMIYYNLNTKEAKVYLTTELIEKYELENMLEGWYNFSEVLLVLGWIKDLSEYGGCVTTYAEMGESTYVILLNKGLQYQKANGTWETLAKFNSEEDNTPVFIDYDISNMNLWSYWSIAADLKSQPGTYRQLTNGVLSLPSSFAMDINPQKPIYFFLHGDIGIQSETYVDIQLLFKFTSYKKDEGYFGYCINDDYLWTLKYNFEAPHDRFYLAAYLLKSNKIWSATYNTSTNTFTTSMSSLINSMWNDMNDFIDSMYFQLKDKNHILALTLTGSISETIYMPLIKTAGGSGDDSIITFATTYPINNVLKHIQVTCVYHNGTDEDPTATLTINDISPFKEIGSITTNNDGWYNAGTTITGTYSLLGDMCILRAYAGTKNGWGEVHYTLPVAAAQGASTVAYENGHEYMISTGEQRNISVCTIRQLGGGNQVADETIHFTLMYRYQ